MSSEIKLKNRACPRSVMCSVCKPVIPTFGIPHTEALCPLRNSRYCSNCAQFGHLLSACPDRPSSIYTQPIYVEQLLSPSVLREYKITSRTPLPVVVTEVVPQLLEIKDDEKVIGAYLAARSIKPQKGCTKRQTLEEYAKLQNKRLVYLT